MKVILLVLLLSIVARTESRGYNYKLSKEYATLSLIEETMEYHKNSKKIVRSMRIRKYKTLNRINELWK